MTRLFDYIGSRLTGRGDFSAQYRRYRETVHWLVRELLAFDCVSTVKAVIFNVFGGVLKAGALAFLLYYANLMEAGDKVGMASYSLEARSETVFYLAVSVAILLMVCGALAAYYGSHIVSNLSIAFAAYCSQSLVASPGGRPAGNPPPSLMNYPASLSGSVSGVVRLSRSVKPLLQATNPLATLIYSLVVLFYLDPLLSLAVMLVALSTLFLQYQVNYQSAQNEKQLMVNRGRGLRRLNRLLADTALAPRMHTTAIAGLRQEYQQSAIGAFLRSYYQRLMAQPRSALVSDLLLAILSFMVVVYLGRSALLGNIGWAHFLGYLLFARVSLLAFRGVLMSITGFARHYPRARRIFEYFQSLVDAGHQVPEPISVVSRGRDSIGDRKQVKLQPGKPLLILSPVPLSRFNLYAFIDALAGRGVKDSNVLRAATICISQGLDSQPGGSLDELLGIQPNADETIVKARLGDAGLPADARRNGLLTPADWQQFSRQTRARILMQQAMSSAAPLVLVDHDILDAGGADHAQGWLSALTVRRVAIVSGKLADLSVDLATVVVLIAQDRSVSIANCSWCQENADIINAWFARHQADVEEDEPDDEFIEDD